MHYALNPRTFLFSHYFYAGLRIAVGVIGLTYLAFLYSDLQTAMTVSIAALCTSLMDLPSPLRHKFNEMLASVLLCSAVTLIVSLSTPIHWLLGIMVVLVSFLASMMVVYGRKAMPLQFAAMFIMTLSMSNMLTVRQSFLHSGLFLAGGLAYLVYSMAVSWFLRYRMKQQILAEALYELARYIEVKADFYDIRTDLNSQFNELVRRQIALAEKQQASRDLILRGQQRRQDAMLVQVHYGMIDLYELVLTTHADYRLLRRHFAQSDVLTFLRDLIGKAALDIESIAYAVTRKRASIADISYKAEVQAIERELHRIERESAADPEPNEGLTVLRASYNKIRELIPMIDQLHRATHAPTWPLTVIPEKDMTPFLTQQKYELRILLSNLRWTSPVFRYSLRVAMAVSVGLLVAEHLPYAGHGYWIVLTIVVILKPSFSMTKQRRSDRLIGTLIGCVLTALILHFVHAPAALLGFLFLATVAAPTFVQVKYRYTAVAASMQILLQIGLLVPGSGHAITERLIDTVIGAAIATVFSYVLPNWEYRGVPRLIRNVLRASQRYIDASRDLLQGRAADDFVYRVSRKGFMDSLAALSSALVRMLDEPASKHRAVEDINRFIVQNYLVVAHVAAIRLLLRRHKEGLPPEPVNVVLQQALTWVENMLAQAQQALDGLKPDAPQKTAAHPDAVTVTEETAAWSGWLPLQRRAELLYADAEQIAVRSMAIGRLLAPPD